MLSWDNKHHYDSDTREAERVASGDSSTSEFCQVQSHDCTNHGTSTGTHVQKYGLVSVKTETGDNRRTYTRQSSTLSAERSENSPKAVKPPFGSPVDTNSRNIM